MTVATHVAPNLKACGGEAIGEGEGGASLLIGRAGMAPLARQAAAQGQEKMVTRRKTEPEATWLWNGLR